MGQLNNKQINPLLDKNAYQELYTYSQRFPKKFWAEQAEKHVTWFKQWDDVVTGDLAHFNVQWFTNAKLNVCYNCVDRHLEQRAHQTALIWEGDHPSDSKQLTYLELYQQVCRFANVLKKQGLKKGDRVCIYMPMIVETAIAMLACARIGVIHSVVFGGFSPDALKTRILDADCQMVITANEGRRGNKTIPLKQNVDIALADCPQGKRVIVIHPTQNKVSWQQDRDIAYEDIVKTVAAECPCEMMDAADPLFILYTSGSTGKPKGIVHATAGYLVFVAMTYRYLFNYQEGDVYWCTADVGWITGHSYGIYGPLANGAKTLMFEGIPSYPTPARYWEVIDKHQVNIFYTAPTAIRALRREGDEWVKASCRKSLRLLGTVGEPINPEVSSWYFQVVGEGRCPIVDTWWQTETGGIMISPLPTVDHFKPGSAGWPVLGIVPAILDDRGKPVATGQMGKLVVTQPWPGMMQSIYGDRQRFMDNYFKTFPGYYLTGDNARCDQEGYFTITGRNDDVIKVSGHRIGAGEVESALLSVSTVAEAAVVGIPDDIKGEALYAFVTLKAGIKPTEAIKKELILQVRNTIGAIATLHEIQWASALPKTRSGKIMRRLLRKIATDDVTDLGDTSTLAEPEVIQELIQKKKIT